ncbi:MAG: type I DNA topoisomerase [Alphaproteobacteria bacterium]
MKNLLIVESPAKAKTIGKYLGKDYQVLASYGHIRDLPSKDGSVEPNNDFKMNYQDSLKSKNHIKNIVDTAKNVDKIILAPDPDREGESIAWHILEVLKSKKAIKPATKIERVVFNAITKNSVLEAIAKPRQIDLDLVNAQQARRALDYLVGFTLSPVLWRKLPGSKSAGRVQSVALRLICDREEEIEKFISQEYWDIKIGLKTHENARFVASLVEVNQKKLEKFSIANQEQAIELKEKLQNKEYRVLNVQKKETKRRSYPPFTTSSLQQESARKLGFSASKTMTIAQKLYEGIEINGTSQGLITYMRTDSISITPEAVVSIRNLIKKNYGEKYLPSQPNVFKSKVKNAQEAHEAIRPADFQHEPDSIRHFLDNDQMALYNLIWKRAIASQMADVIFDQVIAEIETIPNFAKCRAVGTTVKFDGFYKIYREDLDDNSENDDEDKVILPELKADEMIKLIEVNPYQHFTEPPPRYSEASLVKKMEELGIGRPSTYATIISVLQDRGYVVIDKKRFFPEERGRIVVTFLKEFFIKYVEFDYTAGLEDELDIISNGELDWKLFLQKFWKDFNGNISEVMEKPFSEVLEVLNQKFGEHIFGRDENGKLKNTCPTCKTGTLGLRLGKFGSFIGCSNYPECKHTMQIFGEESQVNENGELKPQFEPKNLGKDPKTGFDILVKIGPYGPYLELSGSEEISKEEPEEKPEAKTSKTKKTSKKTSKKEAKVKVKKPKRISIPKNVNLENIDINYAVKLLELPREIGIHPETGQKIIANIGPFGPYLLHDKKFSSVKDDDIMEIGLNRAVDVIAKAQEKKASSPAKGRGKAGGFGRGKKSKK